MRVKAPFKGFFEASGHVPIAEKLLSGLAALIAILLMIVLSRFWIGDDTMPYIIASMGASCVLLFAVPQGPMSQPWPFVGGHLISAAIGVTCAQWIPDMLLAAALAVSIAISVMYLLHCLHPPGGATAITVVIGGDAVQAMGYEYLLFPLLVNIIVTLAWALLINNVLPRRHYPNFIRQRPQKEELKLHLRTALRKVDTFIDASEEDLEHLFNLMLTQKRRERIGEIVCGDIMLIKISTAEYDTELETVWLQLIENHFQTMPVVDQHQRVIGMLSITDFLRQVVNRPEPKTLVDRFRAFVKRTDGLHTDKVEYAGHLMTKCVVSVRVDQHIVDLLPLFADHGVRHIPVTDAHNRLQGLITPKQLLAALHADYSPLAH